MALVSKLLWGTNFENEVRIGYPLFDIITDREERDGSAHGTTGDGGEVSWITGRDYTMDAEVRWIPDGPSASPMQTQLSGPVSWEEFVDWARDANAFRFVPDETIADFYVDNVYLVEPRKGFGSLSPDIKRNVRIKLRNATKSFHEALRGIMFEYAPGANLTDPVAATFSRAGAGATRLGVDGGVYDEATDVLRDRHYVGGMKGALFEGTRQNKIENGDYEQDTVGTQANASTATRDNTVARHGSWACKVTTTNAISGIWWQLRAGTRIPGVAARTYTVEVDVYCPAAFVGKQLQLNLEWWDAIPAQIGTANGAIVTLVAGWQRLVTTALSPANTAFITPTLYTNGAQGVFDFWVDLADLQEGAFASQPIPTNTAMVIRNGDQLDFPVRVPMGIDWTLYLHFVGEHGNVTSWPDTEPQTDPFLVALYPSGTPSDADNSGGMILHRQNAQAQYEWEYWVNRVTAARTFTPTTAAQKLTLRHYASDHHLEAAIDGGAFAAGAAPTTVAIPSTQLLLRFRNLAFWTVFRAKLAHGLRTQAAIEAL